MSLLWNHLIAVLAYTIMLTITARLLKDKLAWYAIAGAVIFLELLGALGVSFSNIVCSLSLLLILVFLYEMRFVKALVMMIVYFGVNMALTVWFLSKFLL